MRGRKAIDLSGQRFGRLVAIRSEKFSDGVRQWFCRCDCGGTTWGRSGSLRAGKKRSCGCLLRDRANQYDAQVCIVCDQEKPPQAFARPHGRRPRKRCDTCNDAILAAQGDSGLAEAIADESTRVRFWDNVDMSGECWLWTGSEAGTGYGTIGFKHHSIRVHRFSYAMHKGLPGKLCVCHRCDNRLCVNPDHLFRGTIADNTQDRDQKHRVQHGERHYRTKLTPDQVRTIRASTLPTARLSERYGVTTSHISRIRTGQTWARLD